MWQFANKTSYDLYGRNFPVKIVQFGMLFVVQAFIYILYIGTWFSPLIMRQTHYTFTRKRYCFHVFSQINHRCLNWRKGSTPWQSLDTRSVSSPSLRRSLCQIYSIRIWRLWGVRIWRKWFTLFSEEVDYSSTIWVSPVKLCTFCIISKSFYLG